MGDEKPEIWHIVMNLEVSNGFIKNELRKQMYLSKPCPDLRNESRVPLSCFSRSMCCHCGDSAEQSCSTLDPRVLQLDMRVGLRGCPYISEQAVILGKHLWHDLGKALEAGY